jgi:hypothetical protein
LYFITEKKKKIIKSGKTEILEKKITEHKTLGTAVGCSEGDCNLITEFSLKVREISEFFQVKGLYNITTKK